MIEYIQRKILLEDSIDRNLNSPTWGTLTATSFYIKISLTQDIKDLGFYEDIDYVAFTGTTGLNTGLTDTDLVTLRFPSFGVSNYYNFINAVITGTTESQLDDLRSYNTQNQYIPGFNMYVEPYVNYNNVSLTGVSRVVSTGDPVVYVFDAKDDSNIGTNNQVYGIQYKDYSGNTSYQTINGVYSPVPLANFRYIGEGFNETNITLSALTKEEYLFGIISPPEVKNDVFIDRETNSVIDYHLRLSEIKSLGELVNYGNGFYNLTTI